MGLEVVLIYVTCACAGGFMFLLGWVIKLNTLIGKCATYEWAEEQLVKKDVLNVHLKTIEDSITEIKSDLKKLLENNRRGGE